MPTVEISSDVKSGLGLRGAGIVEDFLVRIQWFASPVSAIGNDGKIAVKKPSLSQIYDSFRKKRSAICGRRPGFARGRCATAASPVSERRIQRRSVTLFLF